MRAASLCSKMAENPQTIDMPAGHSGLPKSQGPRLQLECPKCGAPAWVEWQQLPHLLRCRGCLNSFWIDKGGHVQSEHAVGSFSVECPRCHQSRQWPVGVAVKQFACLACGFEFALGPESASDSLNQRLKGIPREPPTSRKTSREDKSAPPAAIVAMIAGALLLLCLPILFVVWSTRTDKALVDAVEAFNTAILAGDAPKAKEWIPAGQETAFKNWMLMNTCNRPLVPCGAVEVKVVQYSSAVAQVRISYQRTIQDMHTQDQAWRRGPDGRWQFDPTATAGQGGERLAEACSKAMSSPTGRPGFWRLALTPCDLFTDNRQIADNGCHHNPTSRCS